MTKRLIRNRFKCSICGDIIESVSRNDFVRCKCGETFTDGGTEYIHRSDNLIDLCEYQKSKKSVK